MGNRLELVSDVTPQQHNALRDEILANLAKQTANQLSSAMLRTAEIEQAMISAATQQHERAAEMAKHGAEVQAKERADAEALAAKQAAQMLADARVGRENSGNAVASDVNAMAPSAMASGAHTVAPDIAKSSDTPEAVSVSAENGDNGDAPKAKAKGQPKPAETAWKRNS